MQMFTPEIIAKAELLLAKMIQSAKARGLKACKGSFYQRRGERLGPSESKKADACCALGAFRLDEPTSDPGLSVSGITFGNDHPDSDAVLAPSTWLGIAVGAAFQDAMAEDE